MLHRGGEHAGACRFRKIISNVMWCGLKWSYRPNVDYFSGFISKAFIPFIIQQFAKSIFCFFIKEQHYNIFLKISLQKHLLYIHRASWVMWSLTIQQLYVVIPSPASFFLSLSFVLTWTKYMQLSQYWDISFLKRFLQNQWNFVFCFKPAYVEHLFYKTLCYSFIHPSSYLLNVVVKSLADFG